MTGRCTGWGLGTRSPCFPEMRVCVLVFYVAPGRSTRETEPPREGRTWRRSPRPLECRLNLKVWPDRQGSWDFRVPHPSALGRGLTWRMKNPCCLRGQAKRLQCRHSRATHPLVKRITGMWGSSGTLRPDSDLPAFPGRLQFRVRVGGCLSHWNHKSPSSGPKAVMTCSRV